MATVDSSTAITNDLMATMNPKKTTAEAGSVEAETNKFLTLLVTQLKNQDPMNPLDNAQLTSQLAQLSTVTGVNKLNTTVESLQASYQKSEAMQAANIIGHGVLIAGKNVTLEKSASVLGIDLATAADSVKLSIFDSTGKEVHTMDLGAKPAGTLPLLWNGETDTLGADGKPVVAADGAYTFAVTATRAGEKLTDAAALNLASVASVATNAKGVTLYVPGTGNVTMADIKQIL